MKKIVEVITCSDFGTGPEVAVVEIDAPLKARILQLSETAQALGVFKITEVNRAPGFYLRDYGAEKEEGRIVLKAPSDEDEKNSCRVECVTLNVTPDDFYWTGYIQNSDVQWETYAIPLSELHQ